MTLGVYVLMEYFFSYVGGGSGLWRIFVGVEGLSPLVFVILYGGTKILELLVGGRLVILFVFPPWIFLKGGGLLFKHYLHL